MSARVERAQLVGGHCFERVVGRAGHLLLCVEHFLDLLVVFVANLLAGHGCDLVERLNGALEFVHAGTKQQVPPAQLLQLLELATLQLQHLVFLRKSLDVNVNLVDLAELLLVGHHAAHVDVVSVHDGEARQ